MSLRERTDLVRKHTRRVLNRRGRGEAKPAQADTESDEAGPDESDAETVSAVASRPAPAKPAPGARPVRQSASKTGRPSGKRTTRR